MRTPFTQGSVFYDTTPIGNIFSSLCTAVVIVTLIILLAYVRNELRR